MKTALLITLFIGTYYCSAQNYQCLQSGTIPYYTNGNGYLRGMRIDSVISNGTDSIYYPYHTPRGNYFGILDSNGGSWLGKKVIRQANGRFLFDNIWQDTVVINTQAGIGDSWTFFNDTSRISYKATVTALDTMTILGTVDSIKKIVIEADSGGLINASDPINNFQIILSKNNGFVQIFDLYTFPYHVSGNVIIGMQSRDYYLDLMLGHLSCICDMFMSYNSVDTTNSVFRRVPLHNPTLGELDNFSVGEILEFSDTKSYADADLTTISLDTILSKSTTATSVYYSMAYHVSNSTTFCCPVNISSSNSFDTVSGSSVDTSLLVDLTILPEEWGASYFYHYFPKTSYDYITACPDPFWVIDVDNVNAFARVNFQYVDPTVGGAYIGNDTKTYSIGFGLSRVSMTNYTPSSFVPRSENGSYMYIKNADSVCGGFMPLPLAVKQVVSKTNSLSVYPNPTNSYLTISSTGQSINTILITNVLGQAVYTQTCNAKQIRVNVADLPPGVYFVKVSGTEIREFIKQ